MDHVLAGGHFEVEHGPDWLFVRPTILAGDAEETLAEQVLSLVQCNLTHRLVLELDKLERLNSRLVGQLVKLKKQIHQHGGLMRLCGLNPHCRDVLRVSRLGDQLHSFANRAEAVLGSRPMLPR